MALAFATTIRNARADQLTVARDAAASAGKIRLYTGTRPATGGAVTTLLAELFMSDPSAPAAAGGILTLNSIADDVSADNTGVATWFREVDGDNNFVTDGDVGTSGSDLNLNTTGITAGLNVSITSYVTTEGNA